MKIQSVILSIFLVSNGQIACADALSRTRTETVKTVDTSDSSGFFKKITPEMLYGYTDFNFDSRAGENFNRYQGHSNLYSAGADHISLGSSVMAGVYYFRIDTALNAQFLLTPGALSTTDQTIKNNTIFGHVLKIFTPQIYADVAGGYGQNKFNTLTTIAPGLEEQQVAQANNSNNNWFVSLNGIYRKSWNKFLVRANLGVLYSQIDTGHYSYIFAETGTIQGVSPLTNKATLIMENAEFGYFVKPTLMPFINGGLIQVAQFSNSRAILDPASTINGSLPQLNMNKSGFRLGAGMSYTYKNVTMRVEEKYYNAGSTFQSYQTLAALEYQFS